MLWKEETEVQIKPPIFNLPDIFDWIINSHHWRWCLWGAWYGGKKHPEGVPECWYGQKGVCQIWGVTRGTTGTYWDGGVPQAHVHEKRKNDLLCATLKSALWMSEQHHIFLSPHTSGHQGTLVWAQPVWSIHVKKMVNGKHFTIV